MVKSAERLRQYQHNNLHVTASNTGGSATTTISITVNDVIPSSITYSGSPFTLTKGTAMTTATPTSSGGAVTAWSISPNLPSGLSFSTSTGEISGTPTTTSTSTSYTVTATNTGGSATTTISITVNDAPPSGVSYSGSPFTLTKGVAMTSATPSVSGGTVVSWSISPSLPTGLSFDTSTGEISGTPTAISTTASYTVTATNAGGSNSTTISITVNDVAPSSITYSPSSLSLTKDVTMSQITPTTSGGTVTSWSISPSLPSGYLSVHQPVQSAELLLLPVHLLLTLLQQVTLVEVLLLLLRFRLTFLRHPQSPTAQVVNASKGSCYEYGNTNSKWRRSRSWSISPTLPSGLSFNTSTGAISGTPTAVSSSTSYTVTATNAGGSGTATVTIQVNDIAPSNVAYSPSFLTLTKDSAMTTATPTSSGGTVTSWSVSPSLPAGISLDSSTGAISGTPTSVSSATTYTITASNTGGSATTTVTILVNDAPPSAITYNPSSFTLTKGTAMTTTTPSASGGAVVSWSISPTLPSGLSFNTSTGAISGTPTAVSSSTTYTVTATNAGGSGTATVSIQVNDVPPYSVSYSGSPFTLTKGSAMTPSTPTSSGGAVTSWTISPSLPAGLSFSTSTGEISGTPSAVTSSTLSQLLQLILAVTQVRQFQ